MYSKSGSRSRAGLIDLGAEFAFRPAAVCAGRKVSIGMAKKMLKDILTKIGSKASRRPMAAATTLSIDWVGANVMARLRGELPGRHRSIPAAGVFTTDRRSRAAV